MSVRKLIVQYVGDVLLLPKLERDVMRVYERDRIGRTVREYVPIVRCKDCKYFNQRDGIFPPMVCLRWGYYNFKTEPERFCSWAERREQ